jgi:hypothetical protein
MGVMTINLIGSLTFCFILVAGPPSRAFDDNSQAISALQSVEAGSKGSAAARTAMTSLVNGGSKNLLPILKAFKGASPLAANWLRNTFESLAASIRSNDEMLPEQQLVDFVTDVSESPAARRLAYEWLLKQNKKLELQLIPHMLLDPSPDFRRDAVVMLMDAAATVDSPQQGTMLYRRALAGAVHEDQVKDIAKALRKSGVDVDILSHFGFLSSWTIIGPFDNKDEAGFAVAYPPESTVELNAEYDGQLGKVRWEALTTEDNFGIVNIAEQIKNYKGSLMYATTTYNSANEQDVELRLGTPNAWKLWVNGQLVFEREEYHRSTQMDQYRIPVHFKSGENTITIKVCQNEMTQDWAQLYQFQLRVCDETGSAVHPQL